MAKREFITKEQIKLKYPIMENDFGMVVNEGLHKELDKMPAIAEQDIVKPYLDKLKEQIEQNVERYCLSRESHGMGKVDWNEYLITESKIIELIDNLLSEQGDTDA